MKYLARPLQLSNEIREAMTAESFGSLYSDELPYRHPEQSCRKYSSQQLHI